LFSREEKMHRRRAWRAREPGSEKKVGRALSSPWNVELVEEYETS
jgi:hypothetical protein